MADYLVDWFSAFPCHLGKIQLRICFQCFNAVFEGADIKWGAAGHAFAFSSTCLFFLVPGPALCVEGLEIRWAHVVFPITSPPDFFLPTSSMGLAFGKIPL